MQRNISEETKKLIKIEATQKSQIEMNCSWVKWGTYTHAQELSHARYLSIYLYLYALP